jgi:hypothetical protein
MALEHKRGDSLDYLAVIPPSFADGYFIGWTVASQVRSFQYDLLIATLTCTWVDPTLTRSLQVREIDTSDWKLGKALMDVQFIRTSDGYTISTDTVEIDIVRDITQLNVLV